MERNTMKDVTATDAGELGGARGLEQLLGAFSQARRTVGAGVKANVMMDELLAEAIASDADTAVLAQRLCMPLERVSARRERHRLRVLNEWD